MKFRWVIRYGPLGEILQMNNSWRGSFVSPYKFTGHEEDGETGLTYAGARYYPARESQWLSVDPKAFAFPTVSPYTFNMNNPVMFIDPGGDSTMFFDESGNHLYTTHDGLENAVTVIDDDGIKGFSRIVEGIISGELQGTDEMIQYARDHGNSYAIDDLKGFFNETTQNDIEGMPGYQAEYRTYLYESNGMIRPGDERVTSIDPGHMVKQSKPSRSGSVAQAHTHPNAEKRARGTAFGAFGGVYLHQPSRGTDYNTNYRHNTFNDIVISPKYMYFINNTNNTRGLFAIQMRNTFINGPACNAFQK